MKLVSFSITNYRSITKAHKLPIGDLVVLIGPNNEGKSNILRALVTALRILARLRVMARAQGRIIRGHVGPDVFDWERDYPVPLQDDHPDGESVFDLEFELTAQELDDFRAEVGSRLTGTLPIRLAIGTGAPRFTVIKRGPGQKVLSGKQGLIAQFVGTRIDCQYIPAIRSARAALQVVEEMLERELNVAEQDKRYQKALSRIEEIQQPILDQVSAKIRETLVQFLPEVRGVNVTIAREQRYSALRRSCRVVVDDGTPTELELKGDGVQSLAAISLLRRASESGARGRQIILAIEEPESHLHPRAIHELRNVLFELAERYQVIVTTHWPALVDRRDIRRNILVEASKAREATSIRQIRDVLGVRTSDNLESAEVVVVVEGGTDLICLQALLRTESTLIRNAFDEGTIAVESLGGGDNLPYKLSQVQDAICTTHVFYDDDDAGRRLVDQAESAGLLAPTDYNLAACGGMNEAEFEDMLDTSVYAAAVQARFGVTLNTKRFRSGKSKWSRRMKEVFKAHGKLWNNRVETNLKTLVADCVAREPESALNEHKRSSFDALVVSLETKLRRD